MPAVPGGRSREPDGQQLRRILASRQVPPASLGSGSDGASLVVPGAAPPRRPERQLGSCDSTIGVGQAVLRLQERPDAERRGLVRVNDSTSCAALRDTDLREVNDHERDDSALSGRQFAGPSR